MGDFLLAHAPRLLAMALLLGVSAFFSGSETALFSLSRDRLRRFRSGGHRLEQLAAVLVARPRRLLVTILFGNMVVNVAFFALSSGVIWDIGKRSGSAGASAVAGLVVLMIVIVFGEVAPKTISASAPVPLARLAALPLYLLGRVLGPVVFVLDHAAIEPATRLVTGRRPSPTEEPFLTVDELQAIVELASDEGVVGRDEGEMIGEVLKLHETKVREVMVPRVDIVGIDVASPTDALLETYRRTRHKRLLVYRDDLDNIIGLARARRAMLEPERTLAELVEPVHYVPEQQTVEQLLKVFRHRGIQLAVVVDEYGGTAGLVTLEDCLEEIVGEIQDEYDRPEHPVERVGDREFLLAGDLGVRAWSDYLLTELNTEMDVSTLGGFVTGLLGRIPREGDSCQWGNLRFTVEKIWRPSARAPGRPWWIRVEVLDDAGPPGSEAAEENGRREGGER